MDISEFYQTFFDEADELLADMEQHLLALDPDTPDPEQLNAIFRAAHSIKGGAATFGFTVLQETTHILENILDSARRDELSLNSAIINIFLETKDIMQEQLNAYKLSQQPDEESFRYICEMLRQIALEKDSGADGADITTGETRSQHPVEPPVTEIKDSSGKTVRLRLESLKNNEVELLLTELENIGQVSGVVKHSDSLEANVAGVSEDDLLAVLCFVVNEQQVHFIQPESDAGLTKESPDEPVDDSLVKSARQPPPGDESQ